MKTKITTLLFLILSGFTFSQSGGFYVEKGTIKITELTCYEFEELSFIFPILPEMKGYDYFTVKVEERAEGSDNISTSVHYGVEGSVFNAKYRGKSSSSLLLFKKGEIKCELEGDLTRIVMKLAASEKGMNGGYLVARVEGYTIDGYKEEIVGNSIQKYPTYSSGTVLFESDKLLLKNRTLVNRFKKAFQQKMDLSASCHPNGTLEKPADNNGTNSSAKMPDGPYTKKYSSGATEITGAFKSNKREGLWKGFYENGILKEEENYINGLEEGLETVYYESGKTQEKTMYVNGKKNGEKIYFNDGGVKEKMETYKDDQLNGVYKEWKKGKLSLSGNYAKGIKDGDWKTYDASGVKVISTEKWKDGATE